MSELRKNILDEARRVVVKIGSRILVDSERGGVRTRYIQKLADSVARLMDAGKEVVIVTSGAVGTGMAELGYKQKPTVNKGGVFYFVLFGVAGIGVEALDCGADLC